MNTLGYVIALLNPFLLNTKDVEVRLGPLHSLANDITALRIPPDSFKYKSYHRSGLKGVYASNNLRDFFYNGKGDPDEEGFMLIFDFEPTKLNPPNEAHPLAFLLHPHELSDEDKSKIDKYIIKTMHKRRDVGSIVHKLLR